MTAPPDSARAGETATVVLKLPLRRGLVAAALAGVGRGLDQFDGVFLAGLVLLFAGLWRWWHLGVALTVAGGIVLALGLVAAARTRPAEPVDDPPRAGAPSP